MPRKAGTEETESLQDNRFHWHGGATTESSQKNAIATPALLQIPIVNTTSSETITETQVAQERLPPSPQRPHPCATSHNDGIIDGVIQTEQKHLKSTISTSTSTPTLKRENKDNANGIKTCCWFETFYKS